MTVLYIANFGGEMPRVPARVLPPAAAQLNENLLMTSNEFRPLLQDKPVGVAPAGAKTIYRLSRNADGSLRAGDDATGWITELADKSYVKGQLNDDATERTAVSFNDGTQPVRVIDAKGADRLLGVPAPPKLTVAVSATAQFTMDDAQTWLTDEMQPAVKQAMLDCLVEARDVAGVPVAGPANLLGLAIKADEPWMVYKQRTAAEATMLGLTSPELAGWAPSAGQWAVAIEMLPMWGRVTDRGALVAKLEAIELPSGEAALDATQAGKLADKLIPLFDPAGDSLKASRSEMDTLLKKFKDLVETAAGAGTPRPVEPTKPTVPEYVSMPDEGYVRTQVWVDYDEAMRVWREDLAKWEADGGAGGAAAANLASAVQEARLRAMTLSNEIEAEYFRRKDKLDEMVAAVADGASLFGTGDDAVIKVDPERVVDTRFYIATYVTDWGEESAPSPVSDMLEVDQNDSVEVTVAAAPADRYVAKWRLYRSNVGSDTAAFQFVDDILVGTLSYTDSLKGSQLGEVCPTTTWAEPPYRQDDASAAPVRPPKGADPYLRGLVGMPNGIVAGFIDNFVAFCHPYHPYAWPVEYQITTEHPIVGLGVFGQTLFVGTMGHPYLISGSDSASMSADKLPHFQACVSRRSIVGVGDGVVYASPDGLCMASPRGVELLTGALFARADWQALHPEQIVAAEHEGVYYFWTPGACWALDFLAKKLGRVVLPGLTAVCRDILADHLFAVVGGQVLKLFGGAQARTGRWRTSRTVFPRQTPLAWIEADGDQGAAVPVAVRWYGDGELRYTAMLDSIEPQRLPPGRWLEHEVEIESAARLTKVALATATAELQGVS